MTNPLAIVGLFAGGHLALLPKKRLAGKKEIIWYQVETKSGKEGWVLLPLDKGAQLAFLSQRSFGSRPR